MAYYFLSEKFGQKWPFFFYLFLCNKLLQIVTYHDILNS
nr:MAG TPA: hypothetical protein [Caudoviricetes sp.]